MASLFICGEGSSAMFFLCLSVLISEVSPSPASLNASLSEEGRLTTHGFPVIWNMPTRRCQHRYGVSLPLEKYGIIHNPKEHFWGPEVSLFYQQRLGLYPYLTHTGSPVNGGIPQLADLKGHLLLAGEQLDAALGQDFNGLAVLDWEAWQPLWTWDFGAKVAYRKLSERLARLNHPELRPQEVRSLAKREFEEAGRTFMLETLRLCMTLRPAAFWGFYGFPPCYNTNLGGPGGYTGQCHKGTSLLNDRLAWLWRESSALYPSVYVPWKLAQHGHTQLMVRHRILEALRVATQHATYLTPTAVIPYARVAFSHTLQFLNKTYLEKVLGESAALGVDGLVLWGELSFAQSKHHCLQLRDYIESVLGEYVVQLRRGVQRCGQVVCGGHGRCARRQPHSGYMIPLGNEMSDPNRLRQAFQCVCGPGWSGRSCEKDKPATE
ncbi:hyaluronidase-3 isoform X1 [Alosa sapidissima]|uniref:hyaluronidase-3 isoform X1 n=2 Tax=Alosa sapidissima TaxID=34773 RepID=UPI001C07F269|nr:hyaluronidase-3 isoform X1 [Alosa sapidissima]